MVNLKTFASSGKADTSGFVPYTGGTTDIVIAHDIKIDSDSKKLILGDGQDADIYYDGTDLIIISDTVGSGITKFSNDMALRDSKKVLLGTGNDSSIEDDGTNMKINTDEQSAGPTTDTRNLEITGAVINPVQQWAFGGTKSAAGGNVFRCALSGGRSETITKIEDGTEGQIITLIGNAVATTFTEAVAMGDNLIVPGSSIVVGDTDTAQFVFDGTIGVSGKWVVISYSNNSL